MASMDYVHESSVPYNNAPFDAQLPAISFLARSTQLVLEAEADTLKVWFKHVGRAHLKQ